MFLPASSPFVFVLGRSGIGLDKAARFMLEGVDVEVNTDVDVDLEIEVEI